MFEVLIPPIEDDESEPLGAMAMAPPPAEPEDDPPYVGYLTNPKAGDWKKQTFKYVSSKKLTSIVLEDNPDVKLESIEIEGPGGGKVTIKSKEAVQAEGIYSVSLKFNAVAESGEQASDDKKKVQIGTSAKLALTVFSESLDFGDIASTLNVKLEEEGTATFDEMSELTVAQKTTATVDWKAKIKDFPLEAALSGKVSETISNISFADDITVKYNAAASATLTYTDKATGIKISSGFGFEYNFTSDSENAPSSNYLSASIELPVTPSVSVFANSKLSNLAPLNVSSQSEVGVDVQVGITLKLPK